MKLNTKNPYKDLVNNPSSVNIFKGESGSLNVAEKDDSSSSVLIERSFGSEGEEKVVSGYCFARIFYGECSEQDLIKFRSDLEVVVKNRGAANYMEIEPVLIAKNFDKKVIDFVDKYNSFQRRKPIHLFEY